MKKLMIVCCLLVGGCKDAPRLPWEKQDQPDQRTCLTTTGGCRFVNDDERTPLTYSRGGYVRQDGYDILISSVRGDTGYTRESGRAVAMAYVKDAPNDKPFTLTCYALSKTGDLIGGGGGQGLARDVGSIMRFDFVQQMPAIVKCRVRQ